MSEVSSPWPGPAAAPIPLVVGIASEGPLENMVWQRKTGVCLEAHACLGLVRVVDSAVEARFDLFSALACPLRDSTYELVVVAPGNIVSTDQAKLALPDSREPWARPSFNDFAHGY